MNYLEQNIKGICGRFGIDYIQFMSDLEVDHPHELTIYDLQTICEEYQVDLQALMFKPMFRSDVFKKKIKSLKLIVLDVDGVMTDGGMYYTESGDQFKKFNTKDGMSILHLTKSNMQVAIISSGFKQEAVRSRAELLGIQHCIVTREPKIDVLNKLCQTLDIQLHEVAIVGDDVNDLEVIRKVGFSACPSDAVNTVKSAVDVVLTKRGGEGCVREFIDSYLLDQPLA